MVKRRRRRSSSSATSSAASSSSSSHTSSSSSSPTFDPSNPHLLFALMLSALSNRDNEKPTSEGYLIIRKSLHHLLLSLLHKSPNSILHSHQTLHTPLISLLPVLLNSKCEEIACSGLEIVGAASLFSIEMNEQIALDDDIVKGVVKAVASSRRSVSVAACNALLDLLTTSVGRCKVLELSAIDNLMSLNLQHLQFL